MEDLLLDPAIRLWVIFPIVLITFLVGVVRHYLALLFSTPKKFNIDDIRNSHLLQRSRVLCANGKFISKEAYLARKYYFNDPEKGILKTKKPTGGQKNMMQDPSMMMDMMKGNVVNILPMIAIGGWINWTFSGFIATKVPFPLTLRFKAMLQKDINLTSLDASWVSSISWYFLNVFGMRSIFTLFLGQDNAADTNQIVQDQFSGASGVPQDPANAFEMEWEALEVAPYSYALENIEDVMIKSYPITVHSEKSKTV